MATMRRDILKKKIENGIMLARTGYSYDGRTVKQDTEWIPARLSSGHGDFKEGFYNLSDYQFKLKAGYASIDENGIITLMITQNHYVDLKEK